MPYQGVCYPDACTMDEININNYIFSSIIFHEYYPKIVSLPMYNYPGCSDDDKYNKKVQNWEVVNWAAVITLSLVGLGVVTGTILDMQGRSKELKEKSKNILISFSLISNLEYVFEVSSKKVKTFDSRFYILFVSFLGRPSLKKYLIFSLHLAGPSPDF